MLEYITDSDEYGICSKCGRTLLKPKPNPEVADNIVICTRGHTFKEVSEGKNGINSWKDDPAYKDTRTGHLGAKSDNML